LHDKEGLLLRSDNSGQIALGRARAVNQAVTFLVLCCWLSVDDLFFTNHLSLKKAQMNPPSPRDDQIEKLMSELRQQEKALASLLNSSKDEKSPQLPKKPINSSNVTPSAQSSEIADDKHGSNENQRPLPPPPINEPKQVSNNKNNIKNFRTFSEKPYNATRTEYNNVLKGLQSHLQEPDPVPYQKLPLSALTGGDNRKRANHILKRSTAFSSPTPPLQQPPPTEPSGSLTPKFERHLKESEQSEGTVVNISELSPLETTQSAPSTVIGRSKPTAHQSVLWETTLPSKTQSPAASTTSAPSATVRAASSSPTSPPPSPLPTPSVLVTPPSRSPQEAPKEPPFLASGPKAMPPNLSNWSDLKKSAPLVWKKSDFWECASRYRKLVALLGDNLEFCSCVCEGIDSSELDHFAKVIVNIFSQFGRTLPLIRELLEGEFKSVKSSKGSILRGNSVTSKVETAYTRKIGSHYLRSILGDYISRLISDPHLDLEIDPRKVSPEVLPNHIEQLKTHCRAIIERLTCPSSIEKMPREIRAIAGYTAEYAKIYAPEQLKPLIGGFYMLRFVSPALVTPESCDLVPETAVLSQKARRNLILIAKILQVV
jgi:hypothetical protein